MQIIKDTLFHISDFLSDKDALSMFRTCKEYTELLRKNKKWYKLKKWSDNHYDWLCEFKITKYNFFTTNFNLEYDISIIPKTVEHLMFGYFFNQSIDNLPSNLTHLYFDYCFNQEVDNELPPTLNTLALGGCFNKSVDALPKGLERLVFGYWFDRPVDNLPLTLKTLIFGESFNHPVDKLPDSIEK